MVRRLGEVLQTIGGYGLNDTGSDTDNLLVATTLSARNHATVRRFQFLWA